MDTLDKLIELAQITGSVDIQCLFRDKWYAPHGRRRAHGIALIVVAALGLWYLPFGTVGCLVVIGLTLWDLITR